MYFELSLIAAKGIKIWLVYEEAWHRSNNLKDFWHLNVSFEVNANRPILRRS